MYRISQIGHFHSTHSNERQTDMYTFKERITELSQKKGRLCEKYVEKRFQQTKSHIYFGFYSFCWFNLPFFPFSLLIDRNSFMLYVAVSQKFQKIRMIADYMTPICFYIAIVVLYKRAK